PPARGLPFGAVGQAEGRAPLGQHRLGLAVPPGGMAELDGQPPLLREQPQRPVEPFAVGLQVGGQLEEHRPELRAEVPGVVDEAGHRLLGVPEALDVGQVAAGLHADDEVVGGGLGPGGEGLRLREAVEGVVDLHRGEAAAVVVEPRPLRQLGRVERTPPVLVLPARCPDEDGHQRSCRSGRSWCSRSAWGSAPWWPQGSAWMMADARRGTSCRRWWRASSVIRWATASRRSSSTVTSASAWRRCPIQRMRTSPTPSTPSTSRPTTSAAASRRTEKINTAMSRPATASARSNPAATPTAPARTPSDDTPSVRAWRPSATRAAEPMSRPTR